MFENNNKRVVLLLAGEHYRNNRLRNLVCITAIALTSDNSVCVSLYKVSDRALYLSFLMQIVMLVLYSLIIKRPAPARELASLLLYQLTLESFIKPIHDYVDFTSFLCPHLKTNSRFNWGINNNVYTTYMSCEFRVNSCEKRLFFSHTQLQKCS